jgi:small subunit ribosomal protein S19
MRSVWKYKYIHYSIIKKLNINELSNNTKQASDIIIKNGNTLLPNSKKQNNSYLHRHNIIKTWSRASTITKELIGYTVEIHTGNKFLSVLIKNEMVGHKLGEFASTRKKAIHKIKKKELKS